MIDAKQPSKFPMGVADVAAVAPLFGQVRRSTVNKSRRSPFANCGKTFPFGLRVGGFRSKSHGFGPQELLLTTIVSCS